MGRSILHRKVMQNRRRALDPDADHLMAATHFQSAAYDDFVEQRDRPAAVEPFVQVKQSQLDALTARINALEAKPVTSPVGAALDELHKQLDEIDPEKSPG